MKKAIEKQSYKNMKKDVQKLKTSIAKWQRAGDRWAAQGDNGMANQHAEDVSNLTDILNAILDGNIKRAWNIVYELDTLVRDLLPARLYNFLAKANGYE
jgi:hypothetical protein